VLLQPTLVTAVEIAGTGCRLHCNDQFFSALLAARYADFPVTSGAALAVDVTVTAPAAPDVVATWSGPYARVRGGDRSIAIEGLGFTAAFDERAGRGSITQPPDPEPLETLLTAVYASRLLSRGGCMLHAAAIVGRAGALVFFGPSGSGKTTVSELVGDGVVTDEITAIRPTSQGYVVSSVPWRGRPRTAPLAGLFRLRQAPTTSFTRLSPLETVRHLLPSAFFCRGDAREIARFFETAASLARAVPAYDMNFTCDRGFWDAVPGAAA
jgi:hypothetical protein